MTRTRNSSAEFCHTHQGHSEQAREALNAMECAQTVGIDLPLKALAWEDASSQVWPGYNDLTYLAKRHRADNCPVTNRLRKALAGFAKAAVAP